MQKLKSVLKDTSGAISIFAVMMMVVLLPMAIWVGIELPKMHEANQRVKDAVDSAASSAVTIIDETEFADGKVLFDEAQVRQLASQLVSQKLGLDSQLKPKEGSAIREEGIEVKVTVIDDNDLNANGGEVTITPQALNETWSKKVDKPTIVVETKVTFKKIGWWGDDLTVYQTGMSQVNMDWNN